MTWYEHRKIEQLTPAAPGWRALLLWEDIDVAALTEMDLNTIASWALVTRWSSEEAYAIEPDEDDSLSRYQGIEPVVIEDWTDVTTIDGDDDIFYLEPGHTLEDLRERIAAIVRRKHEARKFREDADSQRAERTLLENAVAKLPVAVVAAHVEALAESGA